MGRALELIITGRVIDAREAERIGLVNELVPKGKSFERALELAEFICSLPQPAIHTDKEAAVRGFGLPRAEGLRIEAECFNRSIHDPATAEGLRQFLERDHPDRRVDRHARTPGLVRDERPDRRHAWMQHPAAYMKPIHISLQLMGVRVLLGSGGEEGRHAAATSVGLLRDGWSTVISPDGPSGPTRVLKKGVLHIALESGVPVVPVRLEAKPCVHLRSWDRKLVPLPFAQIRVVFGEPLTVTPDNFADTGTLLVPADERRRGLTRNSSAVR